jgi:CheY-like chemotaxis protein
MRILLVEDDGFKSGQLKDFLSNLRTDTEIQMARSVASGKEALRQNRFDVIFLDMSLPSYDIDRYEPGGTPKIFGGSELLGYIDFLDYATPVVVVTQFERFSTGEDEVDIHSLGKNSASDYPDNFKAIVYFNAASEKWKADLTKVLLELIV